MKLSHRERTLLMILALILLGTGGYFLIIKPQMNEIGKLKTEENALQGQYDEFVLAMNPKNPVYKQRTIVDTKVRQISALFFPELKQEKFILLLSEQMEAAGIDADAISFTAVESGVNISDAEGENLPNGEAATKVLKDLQATYLGKKAENIANLNPEEAKKKQDELQQLMNNVERQTITLSYKGDIFSFLRFLEALESYSRRIVVGNVTMTNDEFGRQESIIELTYYAIPKLHEQDSDFMAWNLIGPYGKVDPFYGNFVKSTGTVKKGTVATTALKADFFMMLNPITSDLTTLIMSKMDDRSRQSYIYGDSEGPESVTFEVTQKEGKYYYAYQGSGEKYPEGIEPVEFTPVGNTLKVQVMSSPRTGANDLSGVKITVVNKTDKAMIFEVYNDDPKSRLQLVNTTGKVSVVKK